MSRPVQPGPFVLARSGDLTQDSEKGLVSINLQLEDGSRLQVAMPVQAFAHMLVPLVDGWTPPND